MKKMVNQFEKKLESTIKAIHGTEKIVVFEDKESWAHYFHG